MIVYRRLGVKKILLSITVLIFKSLWVPRNFLNRVEHTHTHTLSLSTCQTERQTYSSTGRQMNRQRRTLASSSVKNQKLHFIPHSLPTPSWSIASKLERRNGIRRGSIFFSLQNIAAFSVNLVLCLCVCTVVVYTDRVRLKHDLIKKTSSNNTFHPFYKSTHQKGHITFYVFCIRIQKQMLVQLQSYSCFRWLIMYKRAELELRLTKAFCHCADINYVRLGQLVQVR